MAIEQMDSIMNVHKDVYLVLDKISDPDVVEKYFSKYKDRMLIECFSYSDFLKLRDLGYYKPLLSGARRNRDYVRERLRILKSLHWSLPGGYVGDVASYVRDMDPQMSWYNHKPSAEYALYSCDNRAQADSIFSKYPNVKYIYVDNIE